MSDLIARAKAALEGVTPAPWEHHIAPSADSDETHADYLANTLIGGGEALHVLTAASPDPKFAYIVPAVTGDGPTSAINAEFVAAARTLVPELVGEVELLSIDRRLSGQANLLLARIVAAANLGVIDGADGFIESYNLPVGPIHKAIPFLAEQGIVVTNDGQIKTAGPTSSPSDIGVKPFQADVTPTIAVAVTHIRSVEAMAAMHENCGINYDALRDERDELLTRVDELTEELAYLRNEQPVAP